MTNISLPNITVTEVISGGEVIGHRLTANEGYVIYDTAANDIAPRPDPETGEIIPEPITYYFKEAVIPIRVPIENWTWMAVPEAQVEEVS
jgi:hypothetical protein